MRRPKLRPLLLALIAALLLLAGCAYGNHIDKGDEYSSKRQYELALQEYHAALKLKPDSDEAKSRIRDTKLRLIQVYVTQARQQLTDQDYQGAINTASNAYAQDSASQVVKSLILEVSAKVQAQADLSTGQQDFATSLSLLHALYEQLPPEREVLENKIAATQTQWADHLNQRAQAAEQANRAGDALLLYTKAASLTMTPEASAKRDELRAKLIDQNAYIFEVALKSSSPSERAAYDALTKAAWTQDVRLAAPKAKAHAKLSVVGAKPAFSRDQSTSSRTVSYKSGTRQIPNPAYKSRQDEVLREQRELNRYQQEVARYEKDVARYEQDVAREGDTPNVTTGAEQNLYYARNNLQRARENLTRQQDRVFRAQEQAANTPQLIEEDVYSNLTYPITTHTVRGDLPFSVNISHADGRSPVNASTVLSVSASDTEHAAYSVANIPYDPKQLPSDAELTSNLHAQAQSFARRVLLESLSSHRQRLLEQAKATAEDGERIHLYVIYILLDPTDVNPEVVAEIAQARGVPDSDKLLANPQ